MDGTSSQTASAVPNFSTPAGTQPVLCVDLDGTLVKTDTLVDSLCAMAHKHPWKLLRSPLWLMRGKAAFKLEVAKHAELDVAHLPYNQAVAAFLQEEAASGRTIVLATGADERVAQRVAGHLGIFQHVMASDGVTNLTGTRKLRLLQQRFGERGFDYIGNSTADLPLLAQAATAMTANPTWWLRSRLNANLARNKDVQSAPAFQDRRSGFSSTLRALRVHQWAKNVLLFLPLLLAHNVHWHVLLASIVAFMCFCCMASGTYIVNDLLDIEADRKHPRKSRRPFAAGDLSATTGAVLAVVLVGVSVWLAVWLLPMAFLRWLVLYCVTTLLYSLYFKRKVLVDVILLSGLYTLRILAGAAAVTVAVSPWLAGFSIFFFFSLALVKRYSELENLRNRAAAPENGRGYMVKDLEQLRSFGTASAYASIVIFTLYINNPDVGVLYHNPHRLWLMTPLLIWWLSRIWLRASRGQMDEDPVVFALTDRSSLIAGVALLLVAVYASI
ncbi:MAG TPA: UbiA family prenyltransferase [Acidobacteriaceae bacterium]|jgi:4-hydroxybenzoate polyprenyltransferase/phosphoserine phosphatase|nr:UbiA family prenyltransferase [Acidobacteriaceae bacterium]